MLNYRGQYDSTEAAGLSLVSAPTSTGTRSLQTAQPRKLQWACKHPPLYHLIKKMHPLYFINVLAVFATSLALLYAPVRYPQATFLSLAFSYGTCIRFLTCSGYQLTTNSLRIHSGTVRHRKVAEVQPLWLQSTAVGPSASGRQSGLRVKGANQDGPAETRTCRRSCIDGCFGGLHDRSGTRRCLDLRHLILDESWLHRGVVEKDGSGDRDSKCILV